VSRRAAINTPIGFPSSWASTAELAHRSRVLASCLKSASVVYGWPGKWTAKHRLTASARRGRSSGRQNRKEGISFSYLRRNLSERSMCLASCFPSPASRPCARGLKHAKRVRLQVRQIPGLFRAGFFQLGHDSDLVQNGLGRTMERAFACGGAFFGSRKLAFGICASIAAR